MKKVLMLVFLLGFVATAASAQLTSGLMNWEAKHLYPKTLSAGIKAAQQKAAQKAKETASTRDANTDLQTSGRELKALIAENPSLKKELEAVLSEHIGLVNAARGSGNNTKEDTIVLQAVTHRLEYLYESYMDLEKANPQVAVKVKKSLNHLYRLIYLGSDKKVHSKDLSLAGLAEECQDRFPYLQLEGASWFATLKAK